MTKSNQESIVDADSRVSGQWMAIGEAAIALGISDKTLRRRRHLIKSKRLGDSANSKIWFWIDDEVRALFSKDRIDTDGFEGLATDVDELETPELVEEPAVKGQSEDKVQPEARQTPEQDKEAAPAPPPAADNVNKEATQTSDAEAKPKDATPGLNATPEQLEQQKKITEVLQQYMAPLVEKVAAQAVTIHEQERHIRELEEKPPLLTDSQAEESKRIANELEEGRKRLQEKEAEVERLAERIKNLESAHDELAALKAEQGKSLWKKFFGLKA